MLSKIFQYILLATRAQRVHVWATLLIISTCQASLAESGSDTEKQRRPDEMTAHERAASAKDHVWPSPLDLGRCLLKEKIFHEVTETTWLSIYHFEIAFLDQEPTIADIALRVLWDSEGPTNYRLSDARAYELCSSMEVDERLPENSCQKDSDCRPYLLWQPRFAQNSLRLQYRIVERADSMHGSSRQESTEHRPTVQALWQDDWAALQGRRGPITVAGTPPSPPVVLPQQFSPQHSFTEVKVRPGSECPFAEDLKGIWRSIWAPTFNIKNGVGSWELAPLQGVRVLSRGRRQTTDENGYFCWPTGENITVQLKTDRFEIRDLAQPSVPLGVDLEPPDHPEYPLILNSLDDPWREVEIGAVAFRHLRKVLVAFDQIIELPPSPRPLIVHQPTSTRGSGCKASTAAGEVDLPMMCRSQALFEPKGVCFEIVAHEVAHDLMSRALNLAENTHDADIQEFLDEALADFFAATLYQSPQLGQFCSSDFRRLETTPPLPQGNPAGGKTAPADERLQAQVAGSLWNLSQPILASSDNRRPNLPVSSFVNKPKAVARLVLTTLLWRGIESAESIEGFIDHLYGTLQDIGLGETIPTIQERLSSLPCRVCGPEELGRFAGPTRALRRDGSVALTTDYKPSNLCPKAQWSLDATTWSTFSAPGDVEIPETAFIHQETPADKIFLRPECSIDSKDREMNDPPIQKIPIQDVSTNLSLPQGEMRDPGHSIQSVLIRQATDARSAIDGLAYLTPEGHITVSQLSNADLTVFKQFNDTAYKALFPGDETLRAMTGGKVKFQSLVGQSRSTNFPIEKIYRFEPNSWIVRPESDSPYGQSQFRRYREIGGEFESENLPFDPRTGFSGGGVIIDDLSDSGVTLDDLSSSNGPVSHKSLAEPGESPSSKASVLNGSSIAAQDSVQSTSETQGLEPSGSSDEPKDDASSKEATLTVQALADRSLAWTRSAGTSVYLSFPNTQCTKNPSWQVVNADQQQVVVAATCDGYIRGLERDAEENEPWQVTAPGWHVELRSPLIQIMKVGKDAEPAILVGPYANLEFDEPFLEMLVVRVDGGDGNGGDDGGDGESTRILRRLRLDMQPLTQILPADLDGDGCDEIVLVGDDLGMLEPNVGVNGCR